MTSGSVVILPTALAGGNPLISEVDRQSLAAELIAYGIKVHRVPALPDPGEDLDPRSATAHWVAHIAMNLTAEQPERPVLLVAYGSGGPMLPALGFSQKASRRPVSGYLVIDDELPKAGSADWPDAPVTYVTTNDNFADHAHQAELRGWTVIKSNDVSGAVRQTFTG